MIKVYRSPAHRATSGHPPGPRNPIHYPLIVVADRGRCNGRLFDHGQAWLPESGKKSFYRQDAAGARGREEKQVS